MAFVTPIEWLPTLTQRMSGRLTAVEKLLAYVNGDAPLPEMGKNTRATWLAFQRKARTNFGGIACQSHANRIIARGVRVGADDESPASVAARKIWRDNRMPMQISDAVWNMLAARTGYLVAGQDEDGSALITSEDPKGFYAEPDPIRPWRARAAAKFWRDDVEMLDHLLIWTPGLRQSFTRPADRGSAVISERGWEPGPVDAFDGNVPVWIFSRRDGMALVEPHIDVIDRINLGKLQRLSTAAIQAFRQRAFKKTPDADALPETDAAGNAIDYGELFEPAPGALWDLPAGFDIWESATTDIGPMLDGEKADARDFAAVTGTPISMLQPDAANQSAGGAAATTAQQVDACRADIERISLAAAAAMVTALRIEGVDFGDDTVEVDFLDPAWTTLSEQMDAVSKGVAAGMSLQMAQETFLGWTPGQLAKDEGYRRRALAHQTMQALTAAGSQPADPNAAAQPSPTEDAAAMKAKFEALGMAVRAGVDADAAAAQLGLSGIKFTGLVPVSLKDPNAAPTGAPSAIPR